MFDFYLLEDRILLSADGLDAADVAVDQDIESLDAMLAELLGNGANDRVAQTDDAADSAADRIGLPDSDQIDRDPPQNADANRPLEVVIIDSGVNDAEELVEGLRRDSAQSTQWQVIYLSAEDDGVEQITRALSGLSNVNAVHLLSHGDGNGIQIGSTDLNLENVSRYSVDFAAWAGAMSTDADLLLYGCDLAGSDEGRALIQAIGTLADCDVAASDDATGNAAIGGDWDLEYAVGAIETEVAFDDPVQRHWQGLLATFTVTHVNDSGTGSFSQAIQDANANPGLDTINFDLTRSGAPVFDLNTALPTITDAVIIDGFSQAGSSANTSADGQNAVLKIELDGSRAGNAFGIDLGVGSDGSTIRGLVIHQFELGGIRISSSGNVIEGNFIGTDRSGALGLGNLQNGITVLADSNVIGGVGLSARNLIASNLGNGVEVGAGANATAILGNLIHSNGGLGIDLAGDGVTANDGELTPVPDQDGGANGLQNYPRLSSATSGASTTIDGDLASTPGQSFRIEFFASSVPDADGSGQGQRFLGFVNATADGSGVASFSATFAAGVAGGEYVSATATNLATGETSEFSPDMVTNNNAPVLDDAEILTLLTIDEDQTGNAGQSIASMIASSGGDPISDVDSGAVEGIAIISSNVGNGGDWQYSIDGGSTWLSFGALGDASALLLRDSDFVRFVPDAQNQTAASFQFRAWDQTTGVAGTLADITINGGTTAYSTAVQTASITVTDVNDAPVLDSGASPRLIGIYEDSPAPVAAVGTPITVLVDFASPPGQVDNVVDVDLGALSGIAVIAADSSNGTWFYSVDDGINWIALGTVSDSSARLLAADGVTRLYFHPDADYNGQINAAITFRAWDQSTGANGALADTTLNGTTTAFSTGTDTASLLVNDAPLLDNTGMMTLTTISEDQVSNVGDTVSSILASGGGDPITDVNLGAIEGIAIVAADRGNGTWQYSLDGGSTWATMPSVSASSSLLLRDSDRLRFVPDAKNATPPTLTFRAWDQATGTAGTLANTTINGGTTAYSTAVQTASITVTDINDAPVLDSGASPRLIGIYEDSPAPVAAVGTPITVLVDFASPSGQVDNVVDVDFGALSGIAVTAADSSNGTWFYSIDDGINWISLGTVSDSSARLLAADGVTRLYFHPNADYNGQINAAITFRAWDQSTGANGALADTTLNGTTTAFSTGTDTASLLVNDAPLLDNTGMMTLTTISEDQISNVGDTVSSILASGGGDPIIDVNLGAIEGIAIVAADRGNGTWQYSLDGGSTWATIPSVSASSSLLLRDSDRLRFVPDAKNATPPTLTFRAWDQATGTAGTLANTTINGGTTAYSVAVQTASITVTDVNDAPVLDNSGSMRLTSITEDQQSNLGNTIASVLASAGGDRVTDVDFGAVEGIAITSLASGNGVWQYSIDGGASWANVSSVSSTSALLLRSVDSVRFIPNAQTGTTASFDFHAWDQSSGSAGARVDVSARGGVTPYSGASERAVISVSNINDAPVTTVTSGMTSYVENGFPIAIDSSIAINDVDSTNLNGGRLTYTISANASASDRLVMTPGGSVGVVGNNVYYGGVAVGTFSGGAGSTPLVIAFNGNSTPTIVQEVARQVSYFNVSDHPSNSLRTIEIVLTDGDGGTSNSSLKNVSVTAVDDAPLAIDDRHGLRFDGIDDAVTIVGDPHLEVSHQLTMEAWVRPDSYPSSSNIILNKEGEYEIGITSNGNLRWAFANTNPGWVWHDTGYVVPLDQWTHISVVYDNGTVSTYVNSTLVEIYYGSGVIGDSHPGKDDLMIGGRQNNPAGQYFSGEIDEVRLWNVARSAAEIGASIDLTLAGTETGLIGNWSFNEGSGTSTADSTIYAANGFFVGGGSGAMGPQWTGYVTDQNTPIAINVAEGLLGNDLDPDGDAVSVIQVNGSLGNVGSTFTLPSGARLTVNAGGDFVYDPAGSFDALASGQRATDTFTYKIDDGNGGADIATVTVTITGINDSPTIAVNAGLVVWEGSTGNVLSSAMLNEGDVDDAGVGLTYTVTDEVDHGTLTLSGFGTLRLGDTFTQADLDSGKVSYDHDDSETTSDAFGFRLADGGEDGAFITPGVFSISVMLVNDHSVGVINDVNPAANLVPEDAIVGDLVSVTAFASDEDINDNVSYALVNNAGGRFAIDALTGVVSVAGALDFETAPIENITIVATSSDGSLSTLVVSIAVTDVNEAPRATGESFSIHSGDTLSISNPGVIFNDTDVDGDTLATVLVAPPSNGTFTLQAGGALTYTPNVGFFGRDTIVYRVSDGALSSGAVEVVIDVFAASPAVADAVSPADVGTPPESSLEPDTESEAQSESQLELEDAGDSSDSNEQATSGDGAVTMSALAAPATPRSESEGGSQDADSSGGDARLSSDLVGETERQFLGAYGSTQLATDLVLAYSPELKQLERLLRQDLQKAIVWSQWDEAPEPEETLSVAYVGAAGAGVSVFSIGYVFWALRGGALMTAFASNLPTWRFIDPIAMLSAYRRSSQAGDEGLDAWVK